MLSRSLYLMDLQVKMIKFAYFGEKPGNKHIFRNSCRETSTSSETHTSDDSKSPTECMQNGLSKGVKDFVYYDPESNDTAS